MQSNRILSKFMSFGLSFLLLLSCMAVALPFIGISEVKAEGTVSVSDEAALRTEINKATGTLSDPTIINIEANFSITSTIMLYNKHVKIQSGSASDIKTLTRGNAFTGDIFNIYQSSMVFENITLDGNKDNISAIKPIIVNNGSLTLNSGATLKNNKNTGSSYGGGAIYNNSILTVNAGTISNNEVVGNGGGVHNAGTFNMVSGMISCNTAKGQIGYGGGVSNAYGASVFTMNGGTISENESNSGGGVHNAGTFYMIDGSVSDNTVIGSNSYGGGIYNASNTKIFSMNGGTVSDNKSDGFGGGVANLSGTIDMNSGTISDNNSNYGGGVYNGATLNVNGVVISRNSVQTGGGGIYNLSTLNINGGEISYNTATNNVSGAGGGVCNISSAKIYMDGGIISNNSATAGGGIYNLGNSLTIDNGQISKNSATDGAGIYNCRGTLDINGGEISNNTASSRGGGLYVITAATISGGIVLDNTATLFGNGVYIGSLGFSVKGSANLQGIYMGYSTAVLCIDVVGLLNEKAYIGIEGVVGLSSGKIVAKGSSYTITQNDFEKFSTSISNYGLELNSNQIKLKQINYYNINISTYITNGSLTVNKTSAAQGEKIVVTVKPDKSYRLVEGSLKQNNIAINKIDDQYSFIMPSSSVTITALFEKIPDYKDGWQLENRKWCFYLDNVKQKGWVNTTDGSEGSTDLHWYYLDETTGTMQNGWVYTKNRSLQTEELFWYYLNPEQGGAQVEGGWIYDKYYQAWYYLKLDNCGAMAANEWLVKDGKNVRVGEDGRIVEYTLNNSVDLVS